MFELSKKRIWIAGHRGMVGSALVRRLTEENCEILTADRSELDLTRQNDVENWVANNKPDSVIVAAAKVGGILANRDHPAEFLYENLVLECNIIKAAADNRVKKLLFLGSSCIYPKMAPQPIKEDALLTSALEPTNEWYAVAKIAGIKLCQALRIQYGCDFISAMPTNLYGPHDNYDLKSSHVVPALIRKAHEAKKSHADELVIWGSGEPLREFMHVDDCADACVFLLKHYSENEHINIGVGSDMTIRQLAEEICNVVGFKGRLDFDKTKPDGTPRKLMDSSRLNALGWAPKISLRQGLENAYANFLKTDMS